MGKRSQRRSVRYEKDQSGCMWGLISIFDLRHGRSARKLLPGRRHGSKHFGSGLSKNKLEILSNLDETVPVTTFDGEETSKAEVTDTVKPSVKKLIDKEISNEQGKRKNASNSEVDRNQSESAHDGHKGTRKTRKKSRDMDAFDLKVAENLQTECSCDHNLAQQSAKVLCFDEIIHELCRKIHSESNPSVECNLNGEASVLLDHKHHDIKEILDKATKDFINQRLINGKHLTEDQKIQSSRELMDVLKLISSDEKGFLKLLQDPNSLLVEYVQNLKEAHAENGEEPKLESDFSEQKLVNLKKSDDVVSDKHRHFFRRRTKSQEVNSFEANEFSNDSNRIVILKPGLTGLQDSESKINIASSPVTHSSVKNKGSSDRVGSHFFLSEIKRKLKHAIGKQQKEVLTSEISNRVGKDNVGNKSPSKEHFFIERIAKPSTLSKKANKNGRRKGSEISVKHGTDGVSNNKISNIYIEAKKHLSEMLNNGDDSSEPSSRQVPKTLGRILSLSKYSPPIISPGRFSSIDKQPANENNKRSPKHEQSVNPLVQEAQSSKSESLATDHSLGCKAQAPNINPSVQEDTIRDIEVLETACHSEDEINPAGDLGYVKEETVISFAPFEPSSCLNSDTSKLHEGGNILEPLEQEDSNDENQPHPSPLPSPCSLTPKKVVDVESFIDIPERPSPVSVLEPLFTEDDISPAKTVSEPVGTTIQTLRIQFKEPETSASEQANCSKPFMEEKELVYECVKLVMEASSFSWDEFYTKWLSPNQLLDLSLVNEVEFFSNQLCCDQKLIFDCINEVLVEVCEHYFGCSPWLSFVKPGIRPLPNMRSAILEVSEGVHSYLLQLPLPRTLDQIVVKDMARTGTWLDLRFDTETIGFDLGEAILGDLLQDTILSYESEVLKVAQCASTKRE